MAKKSLRTYWNLFFISIFFSLLFPNLTFATCDPLPTISGPQEIITSSTNQYTVNGAAGSITWSAVGKAGYENISQAGALSIGNACGYIIIRATDSICGKLKDFEVRVGNNGIWKSYGKSYRQCASTETCHPSGWSHVYDYLNGKYKCAIYTTDYAPYSGPVGQCYEVRSGIDAPFCDDGWHSGCIHRDWHFSGNPFYKAHKYVVNQWVCSTNCIYSIDNDGDGYNAINSCNYPALDPDDN